MENNNEKIIKSRHRVKNHGEVFTPRNIVNDMLDLPGLKEKVAELKATVLEPACGEGIFLVEILKRRLKKVKEESEKSQTLYENLALLSLSTLYGIELLEDNAQKCVINLFQVFMNDYSEFSKRCNKKTKLKVLESAKTIISANIVEGNFLTKLTTSGDPIVFSEWIAEDENPKNILVIRTEYTLQEIMDDTENNSGNIYNKDKMAVQLSFLDIIEGHDTSNKGKEENSMRYKKVKITDVYKEEMEETTNEYGNTDI